jgi:hypothetical protein
MNDNPALDASVDDQKLLAQVVEYYHRALKETTAGFDFLRRRGITHGEAIEHFRIGFANRTLGLTLPPMTTKAGHDVRSRLQQAGLYRGSGHEHYNGCLVFPITSADGSGRIVDMYGRKVGGRRLHKGTPLHMHLRDDERPGVWNIEAFTSSDEIILCPALLDALTFWNHGYRQHA